VYNPLGASLPGPQHELEADYKHALETHFGIRFHQLFAITNQPIARFAEDLRRQGNWDAYLELLANSFNPATLEGLMCRSTLSVDYLGRLYDCDFNQMLDMDLSLGGKDGRPAHLWDVSPDQLEDRGIRTGLHCLACTAGGGSSCTGALKAS
jgi:radical SAM/Cys-rich protein